MKGSITDESTRLGLSVQGKDSFNKFNNQILKSETKQLTLLKHKCHTLTATITSLKVDNSKLRKQKQALLTLNNDYITSLNKFYEERGQTIEKVIFPPELWESSQLEPKLREYLKLNVMGFKKLENDHRNLVQHCLTMQKEIKNYKVIVEECYKMKEDLLSVNHTDIKQLAREIEEVAADNRHLRTQNNRISFDRQRAKKELDRAKILLAQTEKHCQKQKSQLAENKSSVNRLMQQKKQQLNTDQKKIYELNVKCNVLEGQLRSNQEQTGKLEDLKHKHQIQSVEFVHKETEFRKTLSEFSRPKQSTRASVAFEEDDRLMTSFFVDRQYSTRRKERIRSVASSVARNH